MPANLNIYITWDPLASEAERFRVIVYGTAEGLVALGTVIQSAAVSMRPVALRDIATVRSWRSVADEDLVVPNVSFVPCQSVSEICSIVAAEHAMVHLTNQERISNTKLQSGTPTIIKKWWKFW